MFFGWLIWVEGYFCNDVFVMGDVVVVCEVLGIGVDEWVLLYVLIWCDDCIEMVDFVDVELFVC